MKRCKCGNECAGNAKICPKCGHRFTHILTKFIAVVFGLGLLGAIFGGHSSSSENSTLPNTTSPSTQAVSAKPVKLLTPAELEAARKRAAVANEHSQEQARIAYAKFMENNLLRANFNVDVVAYGPKHQYLEMKWVLASKSLAFNFTEQQQDALSQMKSEGFKKFTITDGYDESWTWTL